MSNAIVSNVYRYVIDDVINQVRGDFEDMGIDDSILQELQRSWESKVARSRVANFGFKEDGYYDDDHNNMNNNNNTILPPVNTVNEHGQIQYAPEYQPTPASLANLAVNSMNNRQQLSPPANYGLPPPNTINRIIPDPSTLVNRYHNNNLPDLQLPGISRQNLPQNDGGNDMTTREIDSHIENLIMQTEEEHEFEFTASSSGQPIALDALPESVKELMREAKERAIKAGALSKKTRIPQLDGEGDEDEEDQTQQSNNNDEDINSDLDDSDEDEEDGEGGEEIEHIILCLYDKVSRTKNKWKCVLKDGIMLVNGRDYLFHRANGDFEW